MKVRDLLSKYENRSFVIYYNDLELARCKCVDELETFQIGLLDEEVKYFEDYEGEEYNQSKNYRKSLMIEIF